MDPVVYAGENVCKIVRPVKTIRFPFQNTSAITPLREKVTGYPNIPYNGSDWLYSSGSFMGEWSAKNRKFPTCFFKTPVFLIFFKKDR
jgi:hypothetical protein